MSFSWQDTPKPIIGLSPMDGITDFAFRQINAVHGTPSVMFTEFTNVEGMFMSPNDYLLNDLRYHISQKPIIAQIFGSTPEYFYKAAIVCAELGFDGVDINMGCPAKNVAHHGGGAALIAKPELAKQIIRSVQQGVTDWANGKKITEIGLSEDKLEKINELKTFSQNNDIQRRIIPVSVKTRIGIDKITVEEWISQLLETNPANITIHGRTLKQMYTGSADWDAIGRAATIIKKTQTTVLGNGDVLTRKDAYEKIAKYNLDGVLIGRAAMGNPTIWDSENILSPKQKLELALEHAKLHSEVKNEKMFLQMRKHFSFYVTNFPFANEIKVKLIQTKNFEEAETVIKEALENVSL
jgi:nifR3 family TIM-barrel protein